MDKPFDDLRRAGQTSRAAPDDVIIIPDGHCATGGAMIWKKERFGFLATLEHPQDLRNDISCTMQLYNVADAEILAFDFVFIVQGRVCHQHATDIHRLQPSARCERTGPANLDFNIF